MRATFKVHGAKELQRQLRDLPRKVERKILREAVRAAAKPILDDTKAEAPVQSGALRASMKIRAKRARRSSGSVGAQVITKDGFFKGDQFYGAFVELGTKFIKAKEFMLRAFNRNKESSVRIIRQAIVSGLGRAARGK